MIQELDDFNLYPDCPQSLVRVCAKTCVLYSEHILPQLEMNILPMELCRLLVEAYQETGCTLGGLRRRFFAALRDSSGTSPWTFPDDPFVVPVEPTGPPDSVLLDYADRKDSSLPNELSVHASRITGIVCRSTAVTMPPELVANLTTFVALEYVRGTVPLSNMLTHLEIHNFSRNCVKLMVHCANLEWLSLPVLKLKSSPIDLSPLYGLHKLKHLDIQRFGIVSRPKETLTTLLTEMPDLSYLDISETDLDDGGMPGLFNLRKFKPLKFLGLYKTKHKGCTLSNLPADVVSGTADGKQRAAAIEACSADARVWEVIDTLSWKTQLNYYTQLMHMWMKTRQCGFKDLAIACVSALLADHMDEIPQSVARVVYETALNYVQRERSYLDPSVGYRLAVVAIPQLLHLLKEKIGRYSTPQQTYVYTYNHMALGRLFAVMVNYSWSPTVEDWFYQVICSRVDLSSVCRYVSLSDSTCISILYMLTCQLQAVVLYLDSFDPSKHEWDKKRVVSFEVTHHICQLTLEIFGKIDHPVFTKFMNLFHQIKVWESQFKNSFENYDQLRRRYLCFDQWLLNKLV